MSTSAVSPLADPESSRLREALDRAAAVLAVDGRLAGPASAQDGLDDLVPGPDALGLVGELVGGGFLVTLVLPSVFLSLGPDSAATDALHAVLAVVADDLGLALGETVRFDRPDELLARMAQGGVSPSDARVVGAGLFEGDAVVATVGAVIPGAVAPVAPDAWASAPADLPASAGPARSTNAAVLERGLQLLADIELTVTAELGRARLPVGELLDLQPGAIIELDREAGVPIDLLVNGTLFARGEVVVVEDSFALRVSEIVTDEGTR